MKLRDLDYVKTKMHFFYFSLFGAEGFSTITSAFPEKKVSMSEINEIESKLSETNNSNLKVASFSYMGFMSTEEADGGFLEEVNHVKSQ